MTWKRYYSHLFLIACLVGSAVAVIYHMVTGR